MTEITVQATLSTPAQKLNRHARVRFELSDGSELDIRISEEGEALEISNIGTMKPQSIVISPEAGNAIRIGVA